MRLYITLHATTAPLTELTLRVSIKLTEATVMHAVTDSLRLHYAGAIPAGEGEVYNTTSINRFQLPGPFVPYIWIGGPSRGVALFADSDRDWVPAEPAYVNA